MFYGSGGTYTVLEYLKQSLLVMWWLLASGIITALMLAGGLVALASLIIIVYSPVMAGITLFTGLGLLYGMFLGPWIPVMKRFQCSLDLQHQAFLRQMALGPIFRQ